MPLRFRLPNSSLDIAILIATLGLLGYVAYIAVTYREPSPLPEPRVHSVRTRA